MDHPTAANDGALDRGSGIMGRRLLGRDTVSVWVYSGDAGPDEEGEAGAGFDGRGSVEKDGVWGA